MVKDERSLSSQIQDNEAETLYSLLQNSGNSELLPEAVENEELTHEEALPVESLQSYLRQLNYEDVKSNQAVETLLKASEELAKLNSRERRAKIEAVMTLLSLAVLLISVTKEFPYLNVLGVVSAAILLVSICAVFLDDDQIQARISSEFFGGNEEAMLKEAEQKYQSAKAQVHAAAIELGLTEFTDFSPERLAQVVVKNTRLLRRELRVIDQKGQDKAAVEDQQAAYYQQVEAARASLRDKNE